MYPSKINMGISNLKNRSVYLGKRYHNVYKYHKIRYKYKIINGLVKDVNYIIKILVNIKMEMIV
jgi:hypothetical protein